MDRKPPNCALPYEKPSGSDLVAILFRSSCSRFGVCIFVNFVIYLLLFCIWRSNKDFSRVGYSSGVVNFDFSRAFACSG